MFLDDTTLADVSAPSLASISFNGDKYGIFKEIHHIDFDNLLVYMDVNGTA